MSKVGIVCEGGGTKIAYTAGVLACLKEHKIPIDYIVGISSGAIASVCYGCDQMEWFNRLVCDIATNKKALGLSAILREGQIYGLNFAFENTNKFEPLEYDRLKKADIEVEIGVYNIDDHSIEYYNNDKIDELYLKASCALLVLTKCIKINGKRYMDAGLDTMIPIERSIEKGIKKHIVISTKEVGFQRKKAPWFHNLLAFLQYPKDKFVVEELKKRHIQYNNQWNKVASLEKNKEAIVLRPQINLGMKRSSQDKDTIKRCIQLGYEDTLSRLEEIKKFITE